LRRVDRRNALVADPSRRRCFSRAFRTKPLFSYLRTITIPTAVVAATGDWARPVAPPTGWPAVHLAGEPDLGPDVYVFTPSMPQSQIQAAVDSIATQQIPNQFGTQRYALLFEPGTYGSAADPLSFQVGYYTEVAGLGSSPGAVTINGSINVYNQCLPAADGTNTNCIALDNFWRSLSNLTLNVDLPSSPPAYAPPVLDPFGAGCANSCRVRVRLRTSRSWRAKWA